MPYPISKLWKHDYNGQEMNLERCLTEALAAAGRQGPIPVFFRADDVAVPGKQFCKLVDLFSRYQVPLSMSVVPTWLTENRWKSIERLCNKNSKLWCFYLHGWRHMNHEPSGKKQEFGPTRPIAEMEHDLVCGALASHLGLDALRTIAATGKPYADISFMPEDALAANSIAV